MNVDGQCHCGRVTYLADIDPERVSICHCTDCQTLTGSPYRVTAICSAEQIRIAGQAPKICARTGDNGRTRYQHYQHFCGECGSPLFTSGECGPDDWGIRRGSIRQRDRLKPMRQIWCRSSVPWSMTSGDCRAGPAIEGLPSCTEGAPEAKHAGEGG